MWLCLYTSPGLYKKGENCAFPPIPLSPFHIAHMSQSSSTSYTTLSSFTREAERQMAERYRALGNPGTPTASDSSVSWGTWDMTEVDNYPNRDDYATDSQHSSALLPPSEVPLFTPLATPMASPIPLLSQSQSWGALSRASLRAPSRASSRSTITGPVRRRRGSIVPDGDLIRTFPPVNTQASGFRFGGKTYLLTYSQIGDTPNSALEEKMINFGNLLKSE